MKLLILFIFCLLDLQWAGGQTKSNDINPEWTLRDSLMSVINMQKGDTNEVNALAEMAMINATPDSGIIYGERGISLAKSLNYAKGEAECLYSCSYRFNDINNPSQTIFYSLEALDIFQNSKNFRAIAETKLLLQGNYRDLGDYNNALLYAMQGEQLAESYKLVSKYNFPGHRLAPLFLAEIAKIYLDKMQLDLTLTFIQRTRDQNELFNGTVWNFPLYLLGRVQTIQGNYLDAFQNFRKALPLAVSNHFPWDTLQIFRGLSELYLKTGKLDSAIHFAKIGVINRYNGETTYSLDQIAILAKAYHQKGENDSAFKYIEFMNFYQDSLQNNKKLIDIQNLAYTQKLKQQEIMSSQLRYREQLRFYLLIGGVLIILLVAIFQWRNNRQRQRAYASLERQKLETDQQKSKTEIALNELKITQTQLIQSEKMASLGELTAGIAHEIQNPLNFINNFSEVNWELIDEWNEEMENGNIQKAKLVAKDIQQNEEKISQHGKRVDAIVKSMLQHSRETTGQKEPTDINALADEYLRLSYQGLRAKDKAFNVALQTRFDPTIGTINIIPQDIGRVLLNLYNNAFYAVSEKKKHQPDGYEPTVSVSTIKVDGKVEIRVKDNGTGIPQKVKEKIFQPFFTTKPTGQGTGLGLSLSYDIIKAHGGELKVESKEGEGAEFVILIPVA